MSTEITTAMVEQYSSNVQILMQQKESRLRSLVRVEAGIVGKNAFFDQLNSTAAVKRTSRHADTPLVSTPHLRRRVSLGDYDWADLVDNFDVKKVLTDPSSNYAINAKNAMNRAMDDEIITAFLATAYGGVDGSTSYTFDTSYNVIANGSTGMTLSKLLSAKAILDGNEVDDEDRFCVIGSKQLSDLLDLEEVTSSDYNTIKALVAGQIDTFMGFKFVRSERLAVSSSVRKCIAGQKNSILLAIGADIITDVGPRRDKNMATQVYLGMSIGATRMDEDGIVEIDCLEA
ncbi:MAG: phage capsid protein [Candidatus Omnitrophica bacterium]|nr:phage capsid protein [Candidatus Omnitrophota bacterium]